MIEKIVFNLPGSYSLEPVSGMPSRNNRTLSDLLSFGLTALFVIVILTAFIFLIWAGIQWITSGGDKGKVEEARKKLIYSIIGLVVAFSSYFIINTVGAFFGINPLNTDQRPGRYCESRSDCGRPTQWECIRNRCREV